jgi:hypothetical protein
MIINPKTIKECPAGKVHAGFSVIINSAYCIFCSDRLLINNTINYSSTAEFICNNKITEKKFADELAKEKNLCQ